MSTAESAMTLRFGRRGRVQRHITRLICPCNVDDVEGRMARDIRGHDERTGKG